MRLLLAGPSVVRQFPASTSAAASRAVRRQAPFSSCARLLRPSSSSTVRASLSQIASDLGSMDRPPVSAISLKGKPKGGEVKPMFRRQRREIEKKARKAKQAAARKASSPLAMAGFEDKLSPYVRKDHQFKTFKPITHSLRWLRYSNQPHLHKGSPLRILTTAKRSTGGRNNHGHITVRGRGGGHKRRLRIVDFHRWETGAQTVLRIEYDPGRSAHIALVEHSVTKIKSYILACDGLREGDSVQSYRLDQEAIQQGSGSSTSALDMGMFRTRAIRPGNVLPLRLIPIGTTVHALSLEARGKAKLIRSAGSYGQLVAFVNKKSDPAPVVGDSTANKGEAASAPSASVLPGLSPQGAEDADKTSFEPRSDAGSSAAAQAGGTMSTYAQIKLQSGEVRLLRSDCCATIGRVSNVDHRHETLGKAGRSRWLGRRPKVRGVAMNAVDHPHGGGRGKSKSNKHPRSIYGWKTKGPRTRKPGTRNGNKMVIRERPRGVEKRST